MVKFSTDDDTVTKETFDKLLSQLTNSNSVKLNTVGNRECLSLPTESNKRNQQNHIENHFNIENCFKNLKSVITDEFESLKKYFLKEVIIFKNELLQSSIAKTPENSFRKIDRSFGKPDFLSPERIKGQKSARELIIRPNIQM